MPERIFFAIAWFLIGVAWAWSAVAKKRQRWLLMAAACVALGLTYLLRK
jgi:hypothetical protein